MRAHRHNRLAICALARPQDAPSFAKDVAPIFAANCAGCHGANVRMGSLNLDTYEGVEKGGNQGKIVEPGKSAESRLYLMIAGKLAPAMPLSGKPLAEGDIEIIKKWIDGGAKAPTPAKPASWRRSWLRPRSRISSRRKRVKPQIGALAYRPDGKLLALGTYKEVRLVDPATAATVATLTVTRKPFARSPSPLTASCSPRRAAYRRARAK